MAWNAYVYYSEYRDFSGDQTIVQPDGMDGGPGDAADTFTDETSRRLVIALPAVGALYYVGLTFDELLEIERVQRVQRVQRVRAATQA